jgi:hypothetical protein
MTTVAKTPNGKTRIANGKTTKSKKTRSAQKTTRSNHVANNVEKNHRRGIKIAKTLLSDKGWVNSEFNGDIHKAAVWVQSEIFPRISATALSRFSAAIKAVGGVSTAKVLLSVYG